MWHNLRLGVKNRFLFILPLNMKTLVKYLPEGPNLLSSDMCVCVFYIQHCCVVVKQQYLGHCVRTAAWDRRKNNY